MKKYVSGEYLDMTEEEIEEMKARVPQLPEKVKDEMTERLERLEQFIDKIKTLFRVD